MRLQLVTTHDPQPDYLDLPLLQPLAEWTHSGLVEFPIGVHRHVVRFVESEHGLFALKELPGRLADREFALLRHLAEENLPVVEVLGVISERDSDLDDILITRHLEFSLPFRFLFTRSGISSLRESLVDSIAVLLAQLHLAGFFWGDCSLSNTLFRRDAGALAAWVVDTETGELHDQLTPGQRELDLDIAQMNIFGGLLDLEASGRLPPDIDPVEVVESLTRRYGQLWEELTAEQSVEVAQRHLIDARLARLNELGFDTAEVSITTGGSGPQIQFRPAVVEVGHHVRELERLTGLRMLENQARRMLNDIRSYGAWLAKRDGRDQPEAVVAYRWLNDIFEPAIETIPQELSDRRSPGELFHEILLHRDALQSKLQADVSVQAASADYALESLPSSMRERSLIEGD